MNNTQFWYIVKRNNNQCEIIQSQDTEQQTPDVIQRWGPFETQQEAIARRVGLIRAGKCQPK